MVEAQISYTPKETKDTQSNSIDMSKLRFGASLGLSLSRNYTYLGMGPQIGYQFNRYFMGGTGLKYYYSKTQLSDYKNINHLFGMNIFGYAYPVSFITVFAQPEVNYIWTDLIYNSGERYSSSGFVPSVVVGAGLRLGYSHITVNYDLVQHRNSPHPQGFYIGVSAFF